MSKKAKRLEQIKNNPRAVRPEELEAALLDAGFTKRSGKGDHVIFKKGEIKLSIDYRRPYLLSIYVKDALQALMED
jgi:hypothetical protein